MVEEDPTLQLGRDSVTGETILSGLGEPHVQIALDRMTRRYGVNVDSGSRVWPTEKRSRPRRTPSTSTRSKPAAPGNTVMSSSSWNPAGW